MLKKTLLFLSIFATVSIALAVEKKRDRPWEAYFQSLENDFKSIYVFEDFKLGRFGWDHEVEFNLLRSNLLDTASDEEGRVRQSLKFFFRKTRDYHSGIYFKRAWDSAELPFGIRTVDGRSFVTFIDRAAAPRDFFPVEVGDELIRFSGLPVTEMLNRLTLLPVNLRATDRSFADRYLTRRPSHENFRLPTGWVPLEFKKSDREKNIRVQLEWATLLDAPESSQMISTSNDEMPSVRSDRVRNSSRDHDRIDQMNTIGAREPFFPSITKPIWRSSRDANYFAEIVRMESGARVGLIRIPNYSPKTPLEALSEFDALIGRMQEETDLLVLDQTNNGGGSLLYFYELLSHFVEAPVPTTLRVRWSLQPENFYLGKKWSDLETSLRNIQSDAEARQILGEQIGGYPVNLETARGVYLEAKMILGEMGSARLSSPRPLLMIERISPKGNTYRKPMIVLQNEWTFSTAEMASAMFQDLHRATVFGVRSAGAGSFFTRRNAPIPNPYEIAFHALPFASVTRGNGLAIENTGVIPDVDYEVTADDLRYRFQGYTERLGRVIRDRLNASH